MAVLRSSRDRHSPLLDASAGPDRTLLIRAPELDVGLVFGLGLHKGQHFSVQSFRLGS